MTDLTDAMVAFYRARLDEREAAAKKTSDDEYAWNVGCSTSYDSVAHAELHPPSWALLDVAAERELLTTYEEARAFYSARTSAPAGELYGLHTALALRVSVHARHPEYDSRWKP
ncbi:hypothetical protein GCM10022252_75090 [Streptosporangium oxazolinicum]|uniref:Uncharacterized protein n=1 Tax=Streptosporangium oxazolinicum TaxID=909287 RepID=A0ABP8BL24_9ACTN